MSFDASVPNAARVYDFFLGGKDHYAADRELAQKILAILPDTTRVRALPRPRPGRCSPASGPLRPFPRPGHLIHPGNHASHMPGPLATTSDPH